LLLSVAALALGVVEPRLLARFEAQANLAAAPRVPAAPAGRAAVTLASIARPADEEQPAAEPAMSWPQHDFRPRPSTPHKGLDSTPSSWEPRPAYSV